MFWLDLSLPLGVVDGIPYVALVLIGLWAPWKYFTPIAAGIGTILIILGFFLSPPGGAEWVGYTNRLLALFAIWITVLFSMLYKREEGGFKKLRKELETQVAERTEELTNANEQLKFEMAQRKGWEGQVLRTEKRYRDLYENAPVGYHSAGPDGIIREMNNTELNLLGYDYEEIVEKKRFTDLIVPEEHGLFEERWAQLLEKDEIRGIEFLAVRKDGRKIPLWLEATVIRDEEGNLYRTRCTVIDISDRKQAEERKDVRLRYEKGLAACSKTLLNRTDVDDPVTEAIFHLLKAAEVSRIYVFENVEDPQLGLCARVTNEVRSDGTSTIIGQRTSDPNPYSLGFDRWRDLFSKGEMVSGPVDSFPKSEKAVLKSQDILSLLVLPIRVFGHWIGFIGFDDCETPREWAEEDVRLLQTAADIIGTYIENLRREQELEAMVDRLNRSNEELQQFAYVASHDLQEPLRMVASYTQLLGRRYKGKLDQDADEFIHFAVDGANRMQRLIEDLLTFSRVGTHGKPLHPTDCGVIMERTVSNLKFAIQEKGATVHWNRLPTVNGDPTQLTQLFQNLVGNAIKFCGDKSPEVNVFAEEKEKEFIFSVQDNGIGIDPAHADRIFLIFQRLNTVETYPGTGIGLAVCKKIVERHGGRICVDSRPGEGSTFFFTIPKIR